MSKNKLNLYGNLLKVTVKTAFFFLFLLFFFLLIKIFYVSADTVTTSVTVGNSTPVFTVEPYEDPASTASAPTHVGSQITWRTTATDSNGDDYYLIVCSTDSVTPGIGGAPTCGATTWCTSSATASGSATSCQHTAAQEDAYSNNWYAFVCDKLSSGAACSSASQGSGDSGSPFYVNHPPTFTNVSNNSPQNPGGKITWTTTASDSDSNQKVKLLVCKTAGITGGACSGGSWCTSDFVLSNPTCDYNISNPAPAGNHNAYVYVIDEFNTPAITGDSSVQGNAVGFSINNVAPIVSNVTINGGNDITLNAGTTTNVTLTATVTDSNGCEDIDAVKGYAYRSGITYTGCDTSGEANANYCYPEISCAVVDSGNTCTGPTDASADYTCSVSLQYYADPTDTDTKFSGDTWLSTIKAIDNGTAVHSTQVSTGVILNTLLAYEITGSISYDSLGVGEGNTLLNKTITTTPRGNTGLNQEHSGTDMCTNYPICSGGTPIPVAKQKYALVASTSYASGIALSTTPADVLIKVLKPTSGSPTTKSTWWGIEIPEGTLAGSYHGENTITAVKSDPTDW